MARSPLREATLLKVSGNLCSITFDGTKRLDGVPIIGQATFLDIGRKVQVLCVDNAPVVMSTGGSLGHLPKPDANGNIFIPGIGGGVSLHPPVSLYGAAIAALLQLSLQRLSLRVQDPHEVFAGPTGSSPAAPSFRALVEDDLPTLLLSSLDDVDVSGASDGTVLTYDAPTEKWLAMPATSSGNRQSILTFTGTLAAEANPLRIPNRLGAAQTITEVYVTLGTAGTCQLAIQVNGSGAATVSISADDEGSTASIDPATWPSGGYLTASVVSADGTAADAVVTVVHH